MSILRSTKRSSRYDSGCDSGVENGAFEQEEEYESRAGEIDEGKPNIDSGRCSAEISSVEVDGVLRTLSESVQAVRADQSRRSNLIESTIEQESTNDDEGV